MYWHLDVKNKREKMDIVGFGLPSPNLFRQKKYTKWRVVVDYISHQPSSVGFEVNLLLESSENVVN